jgi:hypothetical protein
MHKNVRDALCAIALLVCVYGLLLIAKEFSKFADKPAIGDLATWLGAIGTIGTLIGTIILATQQTRLRNREMRSKARIIIPGLTMKLIATSNIFENVLEITKFPALVRESSLRQGVKYLRSIPLWTPEDANALAHLPNDVASQLMLIKETAEAVANAFEFNPNNAYLLVSASTEKLKRGLILIDKVLHECNIEYHGKGNF